MKFSFRFRSEVTFLKFLDLVLDAKIKLNAKFFV